MSARKGAAAPKKGRRIIVFMLVMIVAAGALFVLVDENMLPKALQENPRVARFFRVREALMHGEKDAPKEDPAAKQLGYPKDDRKKLDALIAKPEAATDAKDAAPAADKKGHDQK